MFRRSRVQRLEDVCEAKLVLDTPSFVLSARERTASNAMQRGLRYEKAAQAHLRLIYPWSYLPSPWISYRLSSRPSVLNYLQPDGLLVEARQGILRIIEIKYSHRADSYFQLVHKYLPVVSKCFGANWSFALIEVVKWFDKDVQYPCKVLMMKDLMNAPPLRGKDEVSVHIWQQ